MNCLEFRRQLNIDPHASAADYLCHRQECARCAQAHERALAFEQTLHEALEIQVPAQLADSILLAHATAEQQQRRQHQGRRLAGVLALAAAVMLAFGIGVHTAAAPLPDLVVQHVDKEAFILSMNQPIAADEVHKAFADSGVSLPHVPDGISFVYCCPVGPYHSVHLIMPQAEGPVTVLYLVENVAGQRENFVRDGWHGRTVPMQHGTLVLLATDDTHFDQIEGSWRAALGTSA